MSISELATWLRLSKNRAYILTRKAWFPRRLFLGRLILDETLVKRAVRGRLYHAPIPELIASEHSRLLTLQEAATVVNRSKATIRRLARQRKIGHYDVGRLLFPVEELDRLRPLLVRTRLLYT